MRDRVLINALLNRLGGSVTFTPAEMERARNDSTLVFDDGGLTVRLTEEQPSRYGLQTVEAEDVGNMADVLSVSRDPRDGPPLRSPAEPPPPGFEDIAIMGQVDTIRVQTHQIDTRGDDGGDIVGIDLGSRGVL